MDGRKLRMLAGEVMKLGMVTVREGGEAGNNDGEGDEVEKCEDSETS